MATLTKSTTTDTGPPIVHVRGPSRMMLLLGALMMALVGFGIGWLAFRDTGVNAPDDVQELLDDYTDVWNASDGEAAVSYMTVGGSFISSFTGASGFSGDRLVSHISGLSTDLIDHEITAVVGDDPYVVISSGTAAEADGYSVIYLAREDGVLKIDSHRWFYTR